MHQKPKTAFIYFEKEAIVTQATLQVGRQADQGGPKVPWDMCVIHCRMYTYPDHRIHRYQPRLWGGLLAVGLSFFYGV